MLFFNSFSLKLTQIFCQFLFIHSLLFLLVNASYAQDFSCIDRSNTIIELNLCDGQLIFPKEQKIENEFLRLSNQYQENKQMQQILRIAKQKWDIYRHMQCAMESALALGGQINGSVQVEAHKSYSRCMLRILEEMDLALSQFDHVKPEPQGKFDLDNWIIR